METKQVCVIGGIGQHGGADAEDPRQPLLCQHLPRWAAGDHPAPGHHPQTVDGAFAIVGHVHPVYRLAAAGDALRLPCFVVDGRWAMLPAFGAFTGGYRVDALPGQRIYLAAEDCVLPLPG